MKIQQNQLLKLLINNSKPVWEIEALHSRCCVYFGLKDAVGKCEEIISFSNMANIGLLESFRFHVEVELLTINVNC